MHFQKKPSQNDDRPMGHPFDMMFGIRPPSSQQPPPTNQTTQSDLLNQMMSEFKTPEGDWDMDKLFSTAEKTRELAGKLKQMGSGVFSLLKNK